MLQRYTRPRDFSSVKLNNSKRKKNERERFGDWVGDYKRAHTHTYMYTYTRIYIYVIFKQTLQCTGWLAEAVQRGRSEGGMPRSLWSERSASPSFH